MKNLKKCSICQSTNKVCNSDIGLLCGKHYLQYQRYGKILKRTRYDPNEIIDCGDYCEIIVYDKNGNEKCRSLIDKEDLKLVQNKKWSVTKDNYILSGSVKPFIYLHRIVMNASSEYVDHINGNTLDNRKQNLRIVSNANNLKNRIKLPSNNTSGIIGVRYRKDRNKWYAEIQYDNHKINLGSYIEKEDAIKARLEAELKYFGKYKSHINDETYKTLISDN